MGETEEDHIKLLTDGGEASSKSKQKATPIPFKKMIPGTLNTHFLSLMVLTNSSNHHIWRGLHNNIFICVFRVYGARFQHHRKQRRTGVLFHSPFSSVTIHTQLLRRCHRQLLVFSTVLQQVLFMDSNLISLSLCSHMDTRILTLICL
jgi:hypothetical protein